MMTAQFDDRQDAAGQLALAVQTLELRSPVVLGVPRGGVPIGRHLAETLRCPMYAVFVRKLPIPWDPEAGFGAVTIDGAACIDEGMVAALGLEPERVEAISQEVQAELRRRRDKYDLAMPDSLAGRHVIATDDGLAAGNTMTAAVRSIRKAGPLSITVAVPCAPKRTVERLAREVDRVICVHAADAFPFAVASFYRHWRDLTDEDMTPEFEAARQLNSALAGQ